VFWSCFVIDVATLSLTWRSLVKSNTQGVVGVVLYPCVGDGNHDVRFEFFQIHLFVLQTKKTEA